MVAALEAEVKKWRFVKWTQGHNVHLFETDAGTKYELVPTTENGEYVGVLLRMHVSRSVRIPMMELRDVSHVKYFSLFMQMLALGQRGTTGGGIREGVSASQ